MNPFMAFCLYVAARVFVQYLKSRRDDETVKSSLHFLLAAMQALKAQNPLTESFLVQLDVDLEGSGLDLPLMASRNPDGSTKFSGEIPVNTDSVHCVPLFEIRESQAPSANTRPLRTTSDMPMDFSGQDFSSADLEAMGYFSQVPSQMQMPQRAKSTLSDGRGQIYGQNGSLSDTGLSPGASVHQPGSGRNSNQPTPSASTSSNKGSSHTSFTPPQYDDGSASYPAFNAMSPNTTQRLFDPTSLNIQEEGPDGMAQPFAIPAAWEHDYSAAGSTNAGTGSKENDPDNYPLPTGLTPGPSGLTPFMSSDGGLAMHDAMNGMSGNAPGTSNQADWMFTTGWNSGTGQQ